MESYYSLTPMPAEVRRNSKCMRMLGIPLPPSFAPPPPPQEQEESAPAIPTHAPRAPKIEIITKAEAEFDYTADQEDELSFSEGDIFVVLNRTVYDGWALGEINGKKGVFPNNFVRFFEEEVKEEPEDKPIPRLRKTSPTPAPSSAPTIPPAKPPDTIQTPAPPSSEPPPLFRGNKPSSMPPSSAPVGRPASAIPTATPSGRSPAAPPPSLSTPRSRPASVISSSSSGRPPASAPPVNAPTSTPEISSEYSEFTIEVDQPSRPLTAEELRKFALEHKDEFKKGTTNGKRKPADPSTVVSVADIRTKISSNRRRDESSGKRNSVDNNSPSPTPPDTPKPPSSPRNTDRRSVQRPSVDLPRPDISDPAISEGSDMYMMMNLDNDVAALSNRVKELEKANLELKAQVEVLEQRGGESGGLGEVMSRLEAAEAANAKTNKLMTLLQGDLDEEINARKQLETEVTKLKRTVKLLQG